MALRPPVFHADEATPHAYQILGLLGRGAFGLVYAARLVGPEGFVRPVALKVLRPAYADNAALVSQLKDEARALARLRHPAFVQVDRLVELDLGWTIVMERVEGGTSTPTTPHLIIGNI
jgi:serine/threonine-protein kinase